VAGGWFGGGVAGDGEEHVVEVWAVDRQVVDVDTGVVQLVEQPAQRGNAAVARNEFPRTMIGGLSVAGPPDRAVRHDERG